MFFNGFCYIHRLNYTNGFDIKTGPESGPVNGPFGSIGRSDLIFKTLGVKSAPQITLGRHKKYTWRERVRIIAVDWSPWRGTYLVRYHYNFLLCFSCDASLYL